MPFPSTRQGALAFNQPLSFDTSSVTDMNYMFGAGSVFPSENHYFSLRKDKEDKDMTKRTRKTRKTRT
jgi:hypothetical protein